MLHTICLINYGAQQLSCHVDLNLSAKTGSVDSDELEHSRKLTASVIVSNHEASTNISHKADLGQEIFQNLFKSDGSIDLDLVEDLTSGMTPQDILCKSWRDVDGYNLLDKAVLYNDLDLVDIILGKAPAHPETLDDVTPLCSAIQLAAFLGCEDVLEIILDRSPLAVLLRGQVRIRPVSGPSSDLFSIIGYNSFSPPPRLVFQLRWLRCHPNERPIHYAICAGHAPIVDQLMSHEERLAAGDITSLCADGNADAVSRHHDLGAAHLERDVLLTELIRQAAACASASCLTSLLRHVPGGMYMRDTRGWLLLSSGMPHGTQFIKFLLEVGFSVKLLDNIDGKGATTALHIFYHSLAKDDGIEAKYNEVYDVTELLVDIGVDVNKETLAFRSHGMSETAMHLLLSHVNMVLPALKAGVGDVTCRSADVERLQRIFDDSIKDTVLLLMDSGFDVKTHQATLLMLFFSNRHYARRYELSDKWPFLAENACGLRTIVIIAQILLSDGVYITPLRREMTPSLALINTIRDAQAAKCVLNHGKNALQFQKCLRLLMENGDSPNSHPLSGKEDTYLPPPLVHLIDLYLGYVSTYSGIGFLRDNSVDNLLRITEVLIRAGAKFVCSMNVKGSYRKHGVFDGCWRVLHVVQRDLQHVHQDTDAVSKRLHILRKLIIHLTLVGAEPQFEEFRYPCAGQSEAGAKFKATLLYHIFNMAISQGQGQGQCQIAHYCLMANEDFIELLDFLLHFSDHKTYYSCLGHVSGDVHSDAAHSLFRTVALYQTTRSLKELCRVAIYLAWRRDFRSVVSDLLLPTALKHYLLGNVG